MVYVFDPKDWNGTSFLLDEYHMKGDYSEFLRANKPIPSTYFPESLTVVDASPQESPHFHFLLQFQWVRGGPPLALSN